MKVVEHRAKQFFVFVDLKKAYYYIVKVIDEVVTIIYVPFSHLAVCKGSGYARLV